MLQPASSLRLANPRISADASNPTPPRLVDVNVIVKLLAEIGFGVRYRDGVCLSFSRRCDDFEPCVATLGNYVTEQDYLSVVEFCYAEKEASTEEL